MKILEYIGAKLARHLSAAREEGKQIATSTPGKLSNCLRPGDVLLVEGNSAFSTAIKYLTQSSWSHAALYVGDGLPAPGEGGVRPVLVEADINDGVRSVGLSMYTTYHTRICRPKGLSQESVGLQQFFLRIFTRASGENNM